MNLVWYYGSVGHPSHLFSCIVMQHLRSARTLFFFFLSVCSHHLSNYEYTSSNCWCCFSELVAWNFSITFHYKISAFSLPLTECSLFRFFWFINPKCNSCPNPSWHNFTVRTTTESERSRVSVPHLQGTQSCTRWKKNHGQKSKSQVIEIWSVGDLQTSLTLGVMAFHMESKVIRTSKASVAHFAAEWLGTCMFTNMSCEFIRASKSPATCLKMAFVRLLTCRWQKKGKKNDQSNDLAFW